MKHRRTLLWFLSAPSLAFFAHPSPLHSAGVRAAHALRSACVHSVCLCARTLGVHVCRCGLAIDECDTHGASHIVRACAGVDPTYVFVRACCMLARVWRMWEPSCQGPVVCITHASACLLC